ncbi:hypothetical protein PCURB6_14330 [Paenibacillus curdlanolyticus]|nr:hypothetical protein PCURB6_14330 [Paenibacillus curdlanolyticus]
MTIYSYGIVALAALIIVMMILRIYIYIKTRSMELELFHKLNGEDPSAALLIIDYKTPLFKKVDEILSVHEVPFLRIILIAKPWLMKVKTKAWRNERIHILDPDLVQTSGFMRLMYRRFNKPIQITSHTISMLAKEH